MTRGLWRRSFDTSAPGMTRPPGLPQASAQAGRPGPPQAPQGPYTYEPCGDVDPMPDYENVLTD
jgi:hypothetical protein